MYRFSIVIPFTGNDEHLEETLVSILENRPCECEILVVHGGPYTDPYDLKDEIRFVQTDPSATRVEMARAGLAAACSEIIHILSCGVTVTSDWAEPVLAHFDDPTVGSVSPVLESSGGPIYGIGYRVGGRRVWCQDKSNPSKAIGPTLLAAFYRRGAVEMARGLDVATGSEHADVDTALSLQSLGFRHVHESESRLHIGALPPTDETPFQQGRFAERVFWRNARIGSAAALVSHCLTVMAALTGSLFSGKVIGHLCGRIAGLLELKSHRRRRSELIGRQRPKREGVQRNGATVWRTDQAHPASGVNSQQSVRVR